jgi:DNA-binding NarL/FixJ family response regulator
MHENAYAENNVEQSGSVPERAGLTVKPTILLVEDTLDMRNFLKSFLCAEYMVLEAANGHEALELYRANGEIDLVISDIMMPGMDGRQLHKLISEDPAFRHVPFLFITARASPLEKVDALSVGAIDYIYKPFHIEEVLSKIKSLLSLMEGHSSYLQKEMELRINNAIWGTSPQCAPKTSLDSFAFTKRETEVARLLIEGRRNKEIAETLNLSEHTVSHHVESIFRKSGMGNRLEFINLVK